MQYIFINQITTKMHLIKDAIHPSLASNVPGLIHCSKRQTWTFSLCTIQNPEGQHGASKPTFQVSPTIALELARVDTSPSRSADDALPPRRLTILFWKPLNY